MRAAGRRSWPAADSEAQSWRLAELVELVELMLSQSWAQQRTPEPYSGLEIAVARRHLKGFHFIFVCVSASTQTGPYGDSDGTLWQFGIWKWLDFQLFF